MKITCPKCTTPQDIQEARIPANGVVRCQACGSPISLGAPAQRTGSPPLPSLLNQEEEFTPPGQKAHRPAGPRLPPAGGVVSPVLPGRGSGALRPGAASIDVELDLDSDLPAPVSGPESAELPAPRGAAPTAEGRMAGVSDLPAPVSRSGGARPPRPPAPQEHADLPAPVSRGAGHSDLPAPVARGAGYSDLPAPVSRGAGHSDLPGLPAPRGSQQSPAELPAPRIADLPAPVQRGAELPQPKGPLPRPPARPPQSVAPPRPPQSAPPPPTSLSLSGQSIPIIIDLPGLPDAELPTPLGTSAELPTPVLADLVAPVKPDLVAPVSPDLMAPVSPDLMAPVNPDLMVPVEAGLLTPAEVLPPATRSQQRSLASTPMTLGEDEGGLLLGDGLDLGEAIDLGEPASQSRRPAPARPTTVTPPNFGDAAMLGLVLEDLPPPPPRQGTIPPPAAQGSLVPPPAAQSVRAAAASMISGLTLSMDGESNAELTHPITSGTLPPPPGVAAGQPPPSMASLLGEPSEGGAPNTSAESLLPVLGPNGEALLPGQGLPDLMATQATEDSPEAQANVVVVARPRRNLKRAALIIAATLGIGSLLSFGAYKLISGRSKEEQALILRTRLLLGEDLTPSCKRAADGVRSLVQNYPNDPEYLALEAQARLCLVRHGVAAELRNADDRLQQIDDSARALPEVIKARALRALLRSSLTEARRMLETLPGKEKDSLAQVYLGYTELASNRYAAAEKAFSRALANNPKLLAAQVGYAQSKEQSGDRAAANKAYVKALGVKSDHFVAAVGALRTGEDPGAENKLIDVLKKFKANASDHEQAEVWSQLGVRALEGGRRPEAEERLRQALAADATLPQAKVALGRILCSEDKKEKYGEVVTLLRDVVKNDPRNLEAGLLMARSLIGSGQPLSAGGQLDTLAKTYPKDARVAYWQGRREEAVAAKDGNAKAETSYRKALELDSKYLDAYIALSRVLQAQGKNTDALAALKQVATVAQSDADVAAALCGAYLGTKDYAQAVQMCRTALGLRPKLYRSRVDLAGALEGQGKLEAAAAELETLRKEAKEYPGLAERLGRLYLRLEKYPEAEQAMLDAANQSSATPALRMQAARLCIETRPKDAQALIDRILRDNPRQALARVYQAMLVLKDMGRDLTRALEANIALEQASRVADLPEIHYTRARVYLKQDRRPEAMAELLAGRQGVVEARALLAHAQLLWQEGSMAEAQNEVNDLLARQRALMADPIEYRPNDRSVLLGGAYELLGDLLTKQRKDAQAVQAYEQASTRNPTDGALAFRLARALQAASKKQPAMANAARALKLGGDKAPYALEAYLMLGDIHRERRQRLEATRYYRKWLELAPLKAAERSDIEAYVERSSR